MTEPLITHDAPLLGREKIAELLNQAMNEIDMAIELPDDGARDGMNLLINVALGLLENPNVTVEEVADQFYELVDEDLAGRTKLEVIEGWINS